MRAPLLRSALAATLAATTVAPRAGAEDYVVDLRCVGTGAEAHYEIDPPTIRLVAGVDRVQFRTGPYESAIACAGVTMSPTLVVQFRDTFAYAYLWFYDERALAGPFCGAGTRGYDVLLYSSHGTLNGSFGPGFVEVVEAGPVELGGTIGVYADAAASNCVLPSAPGWQRAYVCARMGGVQLQGAVFRVGGFPSSWRVVARPAGVAGYSEGDPLGAGVRLRTLVECPRSPTGNVVLFEVDYEVPEAAAPVVLEVFAAQGAASNRPLVTICGNQELCVRTARAFIGGDAADCVVAVQPLTWTQVRTIYR
jgi:hypothetical protein